MERVASKTDNSFLLIKPSRNGKGIFTKKYIDKYEVIFEIEGEIMSVQEVESEGIYSSKSANACRYSKDLYISPTGYLANFLNHSCIPNAYVSKTKNKLYVISSEEVFSESEIFIDYSTIIARDDWWSTQCNCGCVDCRGTIGRFTDLPLSLQEKYKRENTVPEYILKI